MGLFSRECPRCMRYREACICNRATKVTTKGVKPVKPRRAATPKSAEGPRMCGQGCRPGRTCTSIVRPPHPCPCRYC